MKHYWLETWAVILSNRFPSKYLFLKDRFSWKQKLDKYRKSRFYCWVSTEHFAWKRDPLYEIRRNSVLCCWLSFSTNVDIIRWRLFLRIVRCCKRICTEHQMDALFEWILLATTSTPTNSHTFINPRIPTKSFAMNYTRCVIQDIVRLGFDCLEIVRYRLVKTTVGHCFFIKRSKFTRWQCLCGTITILSSYNITVSSREKENGYSYQHWMGFASSPPSPL